MTTIQFAFHGVEEECLAGVHSNSCAPSCFSSSTHDGIGISTPSDNHNLRKLFKTSPSEAKNGARVRVRSI